MINETLAAAFWPGTDPVGQTLAAVSGSNDLVVGVAADAITGRLREGRAAALYRPLGSLEAARLIVRAAGAPEAVVPAIRAALQPLDPGLRLDVSLVAAELENELEEPRIMATLAGGLAALALALAIVGIYGVTSFMTGQRTREIGLRIAVGAGRADVVRLLLWDGLRPVVLGLTAGAAVALLASQLLAGILYGVSAHDPVAFAVAVMVLLTSAAGAVCAPAWRAARADPAFVLRQQ